MLTKYLIHYWFIDFNPYRLSHGVLVIVGSIIPRPYYQPESFSLRADNGQGLILRVITKTPCFNLFNIFQFTVLMCLTYKNVSKT